MTIRNLKPWAVASAAAVAFVTPPAVAQDVYENAVADHGQQVLHNSIARHNLEYAQNRQKARRAAPNPTPRKAEICAERPRYAREYGANHPKLRQLNAMCARDGY